MLLRTPAICAVLLSIAWSLSAGCSKSTLKPILDAPIPASDGGPTKPMKDGGPLVDGSTSGWDPPKTMIIEIDGPGSDVKMGWVGFGHNITLPNGIRFGAELPKRFTLNAGIENLGDKSYFEHLNSLNPFTRVRIPEPGRNAYLALTKVW